MLKDSSGPEAPPIALAGTAVGAVCLDSPRPGPAAATMLRTPAASTLLRSAGRRLSFQVSGDPEGRPVVLLHGTPGSGIGPKPRGIKLQRLGIRLVTYDRPGYGGSDRHPGRHVCDAADDVAAIADHLNIDRFAVVGRSGGGPHALACASVLRPRVSRAAVLVSLAPSDAADLQWYKGMNNSNTRDYGSAERGAQRPGLDLDDGDLSLPAYADVLLDSLTSNLTDSDRRVVEDVALRRILLETYQEGLRQGPQGWLDDVLAFRKPWGFDLSTIVAPVRLWHGAEDQFSPTDHSRWLARHIPGAELRIQPAQGHFGAMEVLPEILAWLIRTDHEDRSSGTRASPPAAP